MIDRYTIKINPAVSHADLVKKLDEMKDFNPEEMKKLHNLKVKVEAVCEAGDLKKVTDLLKQLSTKPGSIANSHMTISGLLGTWHLRPLAGHTR
jgi:hypothetical protein